MKRKKIHHYYRRPRTAAEAKANQDGEYVRGKRSPRNLADAWDDNNCCHQKTWKVKRLQQYRPDGRGEKHTITLSSSKVWLHTWYLEEHFDDHDIPYHIERLYDVEFRKTYYFREYRVVRYNPILQSSHKLGGTFNDLVNRGTNIIRWVPVYKWVIIPLKKPCTYKWSKIIGFKVTWWSHKDIGIDYILRKLEMW